jgi:hypothetical protein
MFTAWRAQDERCFGTRIDSGHSLENTALYMTGLKSFCQFLHKKTRSLWNSNIGLYKRDQNCSAHMLWHFGNQPFTMWCNVCIVWCHRVNKMFVWSSYTYSSVHSALGQYQCIIWFGFPMKWDLYLSNMNWRGIFWTPNIVHLQYQISQVVYMKECMNTHCKISLYHSNKFTVYFDFFLFYVGNDFTVSLPLILYLYGKQGDHDICREVFMSAVCYFFLILTERRMFQQILVKSLNMKFHWKWTQWESPWCG